MNGGGEGNAAPDKGRKEVGKDHVYEMDNGRVGRAAEVVWAQGRGREHHHASQIPRVDLEKAELALILSDLGNK